MGWGKPDFGAVVFRRVTQHFDTNPQGWHDRQHRRDTVDEMTREKLIAEVRRLDDLLEIERRTSERILAREKAANCDRQPHPHHQPRDDIR